MKKMIPHRKRGFTLIETLLVILVIAVLILIGIAGGSATIKKAQVSRTESDLHNFSLAIEAAMNETPIVMNMDAKEDMAAIVNAVNANLSGDYALTPATTIASGNLQLTQSAAAGSYEIYQSAKTDSWDNPYYVIFDATERHDKGISEFYITVVSAGPNAQTVICPAKASPTATDKGIEADDLFLLVQDTDGDVISRLYNCAKDTLVNGAATPVALGVTTKGTAVAGTQGFYIGTVKNADGRSTLCPVNFQPAA